MHFKNCRQKVNTILSVWRDEDKTLTNMEMADRLNALGYEINSRTLGQFIRQRMLHQTLKVVSNGNHVIYERV